jgi:hypothetical protein
MKTKSRLGREKIESGIEATLDFKGKCLTKPAPQCLILVFGELLLSVAEVIIQKMSRHGRIGKNKTSKGG